MAEHNALRKWISDWRLLGLYQRFESLVAIVITVLVALIIAVALFQLTKTVVGGLVLGVLDPLQKNAFQMVFGEVLTLLIAIELNHTLQFVVTRQESIIQTRVVLLIAMLAISRRFIIVDEETTAATDIFALAAAILAIGAVYWLVRDRDDRGGKEADRESPKK
jgi:uncharacterized membrane protein (DUF373 family)